MATTRVQLSHIYQERGAEQPTGTFGEVPVTPVKLDQRLLTEDLSGGPDISIEVDSSQQFGESGTEVKGRTYKGTYTSKCRVDEIGQMFLYLFGKCARNTIAGTPNAYEHIFTPLDDLTQVAPSFGMVIGIEKKRQYNYRGCLIDELVISKAGAEEIMLTYTIISKERVSQAFDTTHVPSYSTRVKLTTVQSATLFGQPVVWESLTIRFKRNWNETKAFSSDTLPKPEIGIFTVNIEGVVKFENPNPNFIDSFEAETEGEMTLEFRGPAINASAFETLLLEFDRIHIMSATHAHLNPDPHKTQSLTANALVPAGGDWAKVTVINASETPAAYP